MLISFFKKTFIGLNMVGKELTSHKKHNIHQDGGKRKEEEKEFTIHTMEKSNFIFLH